MRKKKALNVTLQPEIIAWAKKIMKQRHYASLSVLFEELIRERFDQVFGASGKHSSTFPPHVEQAIRMEDRPKPARRMPPSAEP